MTLMLPVLAFVFASLLVAAAAKWLVPRRAAALDRRLSEIASARPEGLETDRPYGQAIMDTLMKLGTAAPSNAI